MINSSVIKSNLTSNNFSSAFMTGTYLIKAVNIYGEESNTATTIQINIEDGFDNVVTTITEDPDFLGVKDNVEIDGTVLIMSDPSLGVGYYYFENEIDLGQIYTSFINLLMTAKVRYNNNLFDEADLFAVDDLYLIPGLENAWHIDIEYRITNDDPADTGVEWSEWFPFLISSLSFRAIQFRAKMETNNVLVVPIIEKLSMIIDMPDRIERAEDLTVTSSGVAVTYINPFIATPALSILLQNADSNDKIEFVEKNNSGFTIKVYNTVSETYVERTFDYIASGYGKKSNNS